MASPRTEAREEERRLNIRTLVIASAASAVAAAVTSQLWFRGTWVAAAVTPVLVTLLSEVLHRPTDRLADAARTKGREIRTRGSSVSDRPALEEKPSQPGVPSSKPSQPDVPSSQLEIPIPGPGESGPTPVPDPGEAERPASQPPTPVRVYRQPPERPARRKFALGLALTTAALAFVIGVAALTLTELVAGESIGSGGGRTTLVGGSSNDDSKSQEQDKTDTSEQEEPEQEQEEDQQTAAPAPAEETSTAEQQATEETTEETATSESRLRTTTPTETSP